MKHFMLIISVLLATTIAAQPLYAASGGGGGSVVDGIEVEATNGGTYFGAVTADSVGAVTVTATDTLLTGPITLLEPGEPGTFLITGTPGFAYTVAIPSIWSVTNAAGDTIAHTNAVVEGLPIGVIPPDGTAEFSLGGIITFVAGTSGFYTGSFPVVIVY